MMLVLKGGTSSWLLEPEGNWSGDLRPIAIGSVGTHWIFFVYKLNK